MRTSEPKQRVRRQQFEPEEHLLIATPPSAHHSSAKTRKARPTMGSGTQNPRPVAQNATRTGHPVAQQFGIFGHDRDDSVEGKGSSMKALFCWTFAVVMALSAVFVYAVRLKSRWQRQVRNAKTNWRMASDTDTVAWFRWKIRSEHSPGRDFDLQAGWLHVGTTYVPKVGEMFRTANTYSWQANRLFSMPVCQPTSY